LSAARASAERDADAAALALGHPHQHLLDLMATLAIGPQRSNALVALLAALPSGPAFTPVTMLSRDAFVHCVTQYESKAWVREAAIRAGDEFVFTQALASTLLTSAFDRLVHAQLATTNHRQQVGCVTATSALRYRSLIPHLARTIASTTTSNGLRHAGACVSSLKAFDHPDSLCAYLMLNTHIPSNSVLRHGRIREWYDGLPLFQHPDCLPIYVHIARNPDKYNWDEWVTAGDALCWYTNDVAVAELKRTFQTMRYWRRYWPDHDPGVDLYRGHVYMRHQRDLIEGKRTMPRQPQPLLDEQ